jgi:integrase
MPRSRSSRSAAVSNCVRAESQAVLRSWSEPGFGDGHPGSGVPHGGHGVADRLGHADPSTTLRVYVHVLSEQAAGAADVLERASR